MSNFIDMSSAIAIVLSGGFFILNPVVVVLFIVCSAVVECFVLSQCWCVSFCKWFVIYGRVIFSSVLAIGDSSPVGL